MVVECIGVKPGLAPRTTHMHTHFYKLKFITHTHEHQPGSVRNCTVNGITMMGLMRERDHTTNRKPSAAGRKGSSLSQKSIRTN